MKLIYDLYKKTQKRRFFKTNFLYPWCHTMSSPWTWLRVGYNSVNRIYSRLPVADAAASHRVFFDICPPSPSYPCRCFPLMRPFIISVENNKHRNCIRCYGMITVPYKCHHSLASLITNITNWSSIFIIRCHVTTATMNPNVSHLTVRTLSRYSSARSWPV